MTVKGPPSAPGALLHFAPVTGNYTLVADDLATTLQVDAEADVTITLPNSLPAGWHCGIQHVGAGEVIFAADDGASVTSLNDYVRTAGPPSLASLHVSANSNAVSAAWVLAGDLADEPA